MTLSFMDMISILSMAAGVGSFFIAISAKNEVKKLEIKIEKQIVSMKKVDKIRQNHHGDGNDEVSL